MIPNNFKALQYYIIIHNNWNVNTLHQGIDSLSQSRAMQNYIVQMGGGDPKILWLGSGVGIGRALLSQLGSIYLIILMHMKIYTQCGIIAFCFIKCYHTEVQISATICCTKCKQHSTKMYTCCKEHTAICSYSKYNLLLYALSVNSKKILLCSLSVNSIFFCYLHLAQMAA